MSYLTCYDHILCFYKNFIIEFLIIINNKCKIKILNNHIFTLKNLTLWEIITLLQPEVITQQELDLKNFIIVYPL